MAPHQGVSLALTPEQTVRIRLLEGAEAGAIQRLAACPTRSLADGDLLIEPGPHNGRMYIVLDGRLSVHLETLDQDPVATLGAGECVGELSLIDGSERSAFAVATGSAQIVEVDQTTLDALLEESPHVSRNMMKLLAERLRGGNDTLTSSRQLQAEYKRHASVDALTGLHNRRWLDELLPRQLSRSSRESRPLSVAMVDVDHFKNFNDTYGHQAGDFVLFVVGKVLQASVRPTDLIARYGGEEFTIVMPNTEGRGAVIAADRVREALAGTKLVMPDDATLPSVTISVGVASARVGGDAAAVLSRADSALYGAKQAGRNRVHAAAD